MLTKAPSLGNEFTRASTSESTLINRFRRKLLDRAVLRPSRGHLDHAPQQRHVFRSKHGNLDYFTHSQSIVAGECESGDPDANEREWLVVKFPGTSGRAERSSRFPLDLLSRCRGQVWTLNPPGYGKSEGRPSLATHVDVAAEFVAYAISSVMANQSNNTTNVLLCGNSLGSATALGVAARICQGNLLLDGVSIGLLLRNVPPLTEVVRRVAARYPLGHLMHRVAAATPSEMNAIQSATKVTLPAVFLQSECDSLVPPELQQQVFESYGGSKRVLTLSGLEHDGLLTTKHLAEITIAMQWLVEAVTDGTRETSVSQS